MENKSERRVLKKPTVWRELYFYRKSDVIYQLTVEFCHRFLPTSGDRTVDQMIQAARSGKQNIIEGCEDGQTSSESELKLLNVSRGSFQELKADYGDYLKTRHLSIWPTDNERQQRLLDFCRLHNDFPDYAPLINKMNSEDYANLMITLLHQTDKMMCTYIKKLEQRFITEGGIKERMYSMRTGYLQDQKQLLKQLQSENHQLQSKIQQLQSENYQLKRLIEILKKDK